MTREEFIKELEKGGLHDKIYSYEIEGDKLVVTYHWDVYLALLKTLPTGVVFRNNGDVNLGSLETLPPGVEFMNKGYVNLESLKTLPPGVEFNNIGGVYLESLKTLPPDVKFNNKGDVHLDSLETISPGVKFNNRGCVYFGSKLPQIHPGAEFNNWVFNDDEEESYEIYYKDGRGGRFFSKSFHIKGIAPNTLLNGIIKRGIFL